MTMPTTHFKDADRFEYLSGLGVYHEYDLNFAPEGLAANTRLVKIRGAQGCVAHRTEHTAEGPVWAVHRTDLWHRVRV